MRAVILIHGAWQGSWVWDAFVPLLKAAGFTPIAVDLPGNGANAVPPEDVTAKDCLDYLCNILTGIGSAHVIGHSGGGIFASMLAEAMPESVLTLTYVAGMMLPDNMGFAEIVASVLPEHPEAKGIGPYLVWSEDRRVTCAPPAAALDIFLHDCPPQAAMQAAQRLTPQGEGGRAIKPRLSLDRYARVPRLYVEATQDRSVVLAVQRRMQQLVPGASRVAIETGHVPQLAAPDELLTIIKPFLLAHESPEDTPPLTL